MHILAQSRGLKINTSTGGGACLLPLVAFCLNAHGVRIDAESETLVPLTGGGFDVAQPWAVRRLTPRECEKLQGFSPDFTRIPYRGKTADLCPDGPRYKAIGNSMAVNCMAWLGERIEIVDQWGDTARKEVR